MLQGPALNNMVCDIFNWQLAKHIHMLRSSAKLAHPLAPWLPPEPASGDSKGVPAKAHPADTLQLCKGEIRSSQVQGAPGQVTHTHPSDIRAQQNVVTRALGVAWAQQSSCLLGISQPLAPEGLQGMFHLLLRELQLQNVRSTQPPSDSRVPLSAGHHTQHGEGVPTACMTSSLCTQTA
jgi:hypothetical protein